MSWAAPEWQPATLKERVNSHFQGGDPRPRSERYSPVRLGYDLARSGGRAYQESPLWQRCPVCGRDCCGEDKLAEHLEARHPGHRAVPVNVPALLPAGEPPAP